MAKKVKSFIKDSNDFLCKLRDLPPLPENGLLCSIDVVVLYPSIPHGAGLQATKKALEGREDKSVSTETLLSLAVEMEIYRRYLSGMGTQGRKIVGVHRVP